MNGRHLRRILPIANDGWRFILPPVALCLFFSVLGWWGISGFFLLLALCVAGFFRDPERRVPKRPGLILSPADGKIVYIDEFDATTPDGQVHRLRRIGIFLTVFNVHIQRIPTYGTVTGVKYNPGKFINAIKDKASDENENIMIWFDSPLGPLGVKQIAGVIARRIVCWVKPGDHLLAGERIGLIRFGSRAEVFFPLEAQVKARVGEWVCGGLSVMAEMPAGDSRDRK